MKHPRRAAVLLISLFAMSLSLKAQTTEHNVNVTIKPSQTVEERVADSLKEKELREAGEERIAAEKSARVASTNPRALLAGAQTVFVESDTEFFDSIQLQNALRKRAEFEAWNMVIIDDWQKRQVADIMIEIDRPLFTFTYTYKITDRNGILLTTGKTNAWDGNVAAPLLTARIIEDIKKARGEMPKKK
jgi:hypothetical protein